MSDPVPAPPDLRIVPLGPEHRDEVLRVDQAAFAMPASEFDPVLDTAHFEWDRSFAAIRPTTGPRRRPASTTWAEDEEIAGQLTSYSLQLAVPGRGTTVRAIAVAGLSWVAVHPDHRRRGVLSALMRHHLDGLHESGADSNHGEAISALFASEPAIYRRYGYGESASGVRMTLSRGTPLRPVPGTDEVSTQLFGTPAEDAADIVDEVIAAALLVRPGQMSRPRVATVAFLRDRLALNPGLEPKQLVIARRGDRPTGHAIFRRSHAWTPDGSPAGRVDLLELVALDAPSLHQVWTRVLNLDLMVELTTPLVGLDDPLLAWLQNARGVARRSDALWLRLVDVDRAMTARGYARDVDVVFDLTDEMCPWNARRWRLTVVGDEVSCTASTDPAALRLDTRDLATVYLGGGSLAALAAAGLVAEEQRGAVEALSAALRGPVEPAVPPMF